MGKRGKEDRLKGCGCNGYKMMLLRLGRETPRKGGRVRCNKWIWCLERAIGLDEPEYRVGRCKDLCEQWETDSKARAKRERY